MRRELLKTTRNIIVGNPNISMANKYKENKNMLFADPVAQ